MRTLLKQCILVSNSLAASLCCNAGVYSQSIYSAGVSYTDVCTFDLPFPPGHYKLTDESWVENADGQMLGFSSKRGLGDVRCNTLEVEYGSSNRFILPLNPGRARYHDVDDRSPVAGSGDLMQLVTQCVTNRGGHLAKNATSAVQMDWKRQSGDRLDVIIVAGDHVAEIRKGLEEVYGPTDGAIHSTTSFREQDCPSVIFGPQQTGVVLSVACDPMCEPKFTIISVIGRAKAGT